MKKYNTIRRDFYEKEIFPKTVNSDNYDNAVQRNFQAHWLEKTNPTKSSAPHDGGFDGENLSVQRDFFTSTDLRQNREDETETIASLP